MFARKQKRLREADEEGAPDTKRRAVDKQTTSMFDKKPRVGMRLDARDVDYIWSQATIVKVRKQHVTVRFDGWIKSYDETVEWNSDRLAPLHSFSKCVKCLVDLMPRKKGTPTESELELLPDVAPETYSNLWPCKVQFRMPHPIVHGEDDEKDCEDARDSLRTEANIFVQPYEKQHLPRRFQRSLKETGGIWLEFKRVQPWNHNPFELGVLPEHFRETFHLAKMDEDTPGELFPNVVEKGSLLKEEYQVHTREGASVRDGALHKENDDKEEEEEEIEVVEEQVEVAEGQNEDEEEEEEEEEEDFVVTATRTATKVQPESQQMPVQGAPKETLKVEKKSVGSSCVIS